MGHFGRRPIMHVWYGIVLPGLVLNYFGQAALLIDDPEALESPFYRLAPDWGVTPLAVLATMASIIASQALISGAFSLTVQAMQSDYLPRLMVLHTSSHHRGQVYVPLVNWAPDGRLRRPRHRLPDVEQPRGRLRHRRHHHDGDHVDPLLRGRPRPLGMVPRQGHADRDPAAAGRPRVPGRQHPEDPPRWLVPARRGGGAAGADGHLAQGPADRRRPHPAGRAHASIRSSARPPGRGPRRRAPRCSCSRTRGRRRRRWSTTCATTRSSTSAPSSSPSSPATRPGSLGGERRATIEDAPARRCARSSSASATSRSPTCPGPWPPSRSTVCPSTWTRPPTSWAGSP